MIAANLTKEYGNTNIKAAERLSAGSTSRFTTTYGITAPYTVIDRRLGLLVRNVFLRPTDKYTERERSVILREYSEYWPSASRRALMEEKMNGVARNTDLVFCDTLGTPPSISSISTTDVQDFHDMHYVGSNTTLIVVGPLNKVGLEKLVHSSGIEDVSTGTRVPPSSTSNWIRPENGKSRKVTVTYDAKTDTQTEFGIVSRILFPATFGDDKCSTLASIVRCSFGEEAFRFIREKHTWSYGIRARTNRIARDFTTIDIGSMTPPHVTKDEFFYCLGSAHGAAQNSKKGFERIRTQVAASLILDEWSVDDIVSTLGYELCLNGTPPNILTKFDETLDISFDDFQFSHDSIQKNRFEYAYVGKKATK